jgi:thiosulfate/3-mercaptopyruvate sulfurtransferase
MLIKVAQLDKKIRKGQNVIIIDTRFDLNNVHAGYEQYALEHIPGAVYLHLEQDLSGDITPGKTGRHPLPELTKLASLKALAQADTDIIFYDDSFGAYAARAWWLFHYLDIENIYVLDGGLKAWKQEGLTVESGTQNQQAIELAKESAAAQSQLQTRTDIFANEAWVREEFRKPENLLIDARSSQRFRGKIEPIDRIAGHIPGAVNFDFMENLASNGTFKTIAELRQRFEGIAQSDKLPIHYCGSGVTACHNYFAMKLCGFEPGRLFVGSWSRWICEDNNPVETGPSKSEYQL